MGRNVCITAADGHIGYLIAELILSDHDFGTQADTVSVLTLDPDSASIKNLGDLGANIVVHEPGRVRQMIKTLEEAGCDTVCIIPPAHKEKYDITAELIDATKKANVPSVLFMSSAGVDMAERDKQPHLRQLIDLECLVMAPNGDRETPIGHSPVIIRAGFYAENLLLYAPQAQTDGILPIPIGTSHLFAPITYGDVALVAAHILSSRGPVGSGFADAHHGQLMTLTGPKLCTGTELASLAAITLGIPMQFEDISEREAQKVLQVPHDQDPTELQYLLEYYRLVREGKTNYVATTGFVNVTGESPQEPEEFFTLYAEGFKDGGALEEREGILEAEDRFKDDDAKREKEGKRKIKRRKLWPGEGQFLGSNWQDWK